MSGAQSAEPILVSVADACKLVARSRPTLYQLLARGEIKAKRHGGRTLIVVESIRQWAANLPDMQPSRSS